MKSIDLLGMGLKNLWRRKLRTFLTVLGVIIGTASIVIMVSLGFGMTESFQQQLAQMGNLHVITVNPAYDYYGGEGESTIDATLELDDEAVSAFSMIDGVQAVTPVLQSSMKMASGRYVSHVSIMGIKPETMQYFDYDISAGRLLEETDKLSIVFGSSVPANFYNPREQSRGGGGSYRMMGSRGGVMVSSSSGGFGGEMSAEEELPVDVLNDKMEITFNMSYGESQSGGASDRNNSKVYRVNGVGILESGDYSTDYYIFMPLDQLQEMIDENNRNQRQQGNNSNNEQDQYSQIMIKVENMEDVQAVQEQVMAMGYNAYSLNDMLESMEDTASTLQAVLGGIGAVSLFVAALGITNTMIMSIYERTREIGIMKVIGAALSDIRKLFLLEAAIIGFAGGVTGIAFSYSASYFLNNSSLSLFGGGMMDSRISVIPMWLTFATIGFSTLVGIISGFYPARRAMKLSALEAIKTE